MATIVDYFVDPSVLSDGGSGTVGSPWTRADGNPLEYAIDTINDSATGDRINIKAGGTNTLPGPIALGNNFRPSIVKPLIIRGYTSAAQDGGIGVISGEGSGIWASQSRNYVQWIDLELTNTGTDAVIDCTNNDGMQFINCEIHDSTSHGLDMGLNSSVVNCYIHNVAHGVRVTDDSLVFQNYISEVDTGIDVDSHNCCLDRNIIYIDNIASTTGGIMITNGARAFVVNNTILSAAGGVGSGIKTIEPLHQLGFYGNVVEGFDGTGGKGITTAATEQAIHMAGYNAVNDCTTNYTWSGRELFTRGNQDLSTASVFAKSGALTFANRNAYFNLTSASGLRDAMPDGTAMGAVYAQ